MKGWTGCPKCYGTGLVGGFHVPCDARDEGPTEIIRGLLSRFNVDADETERLLGLRTWFSRHTWFASVVFQGEQDGEPFYHHYSLLYSDIEPSPFWKSDS